ncbi:MAG: endonuclease III domain-containing protein [Candidatus Omnitrophica bacterium]|nr:endonuclease III domain-containing protein [Candidatus Omnitrophota bacterium]MBU4478304.1 endonuclease III domain-containing protein [Candidatus Omnitrophota bacterium]MCG2703371.1 endonuclease III domain-containing protein [Candidatus Omnitrophota bacterium]
MRENIFYEIYHALYGFYGPQFWWPAETQLEVIVGAILTQNTAWKNVEKAISNLKRHSVLSVETLSEIDEGELAAMIRPSGYYNLKAGRLKNFIVFLADNYALSLPDMLKQNAARLREQLLGVKGLGEETVDSILLYAAGKPVFVVDTYTRRIFSRHGLVEPGDSYRNIQSKFMKNLKSEIKLYNEYHALIVSHAKTMCTKQPRCKECPLRSLFKIKKGE